MDDDLRAAPVHRDGASNFHLLSSQRLEFAKLAPIGSEDNGAERTLAIIGAKIQKGVSSTRSHHAHNPPRHTALLAHMPPRLAKIHARCFRGALAGVTRSPAPVGTEERKCEHYCQKAGYRNPFGRHIHVKLAKQVTVRMHSRRSAPRASPRPHLASIPERGRVGGSPELPASRRAPYGYFGRSSIWRLLRGR